MKLIFIEGRKRRLASQSIGEYLFHVIALSAELYSQHPFLVLISTNEGTFRTIFMRRVEENSFYDILINDFLESGLARGIDPSMVRKSIYGIIGAALEDLIQSHLQNLEFDPEETANFLANVFSYPLRVVPIKKRIGNPASRAPSF